ncbi:aldose epimerase family protein [Maritimibacter sp. UBA3975]|uniref:aldose epimerase family protein n=1 Tax=Maritimibacter sp. UBA3975 TaxID=1946833 RepID=UPI0025BFB3F4|nr:aldose epimerase family protein [Maritimibacter sp. UBA3975]
MSETGTHIQPFATLADGTTVQAVTITGGGATATVLTRGATLQDFRIQGVDQSLVLGSAGIAAYAGPMRYFGAIVGPVANRIAGGRMPLGGQVFDLDRNEAGKTTLHGGSTGFSEQDWTIAETTPNTVVLTLEHPDGRDGFPGNIAVRARYALDDAGVLTVEITGTTDAPTYFGPAFHGYWTLNGAGDLSAHRMTIPAERYLAVDADLIPQDAPTPVAGTRFDFREPHAPDPALDHNFCFDGAQGDMRLVCRLETDALRLEIESTEIGLQVYTGGALDTAPFAGHEGRPYGPGAGIALEPQFWPDTPNHPDYPGSVLSPGETYRQVTRFAVTRQTKRPL